MVVAIARRKPNAPVMLTAVIAGSPDIGDTHLVAV